MVIAVLVTDVGAGSGASLTAGVRWRCAYRWLVQLRCAYCSWEVALRLPRFAVALRLLRGVVVGSGDVLVFRAWGPLRPLPSTSFR